MNDVDPTSTSTDSSESPRPDGQSRRRSATCFSAAPSLVLTVLAAPLAAAARIAPHFGHPLTAAVLAERCNNGFSSVALHVLKWPACAGD